MFCRPQVFSCRLGSEQETALSIIDPVNIQVELCGSPTYQSSSGLLDAFNVEDVPPLLEVEKASLCGGQMFPERFVSGVLLGLKAR